MLVVVLLAAVVGLPFAFRPGQRPSATDGDALTLVVITPHNEQIRYETARAFSRWHEERFGRPVAIDWRTPGGASDIRRILQSQYTAALRRSLQTGKPLESVGYDIVFGGGDYEFDQYYRRIGVTVGEHRASLTQPIVFDINEIDVAAVYGSTGELAGNALYDRSIRDEAKPGGNPPGHWWGVVLSGFGIVYNRDVLADLNLTEPTTWADLTDPRFFGNIALADPSHSGSIKVTYNAILQRLGMREGLAVLRRCFANARYFTAGSSRVPLDVSAGEAAAGMCIDFYGRYQSESIGSERIDYITPAGLTTYTSDPVAVLNGVRDDPSRPEGPHAQRLTLAKRFVQFQLTRAGQAVWCYPAREPMNVPPEDGLGPWRFELRRPPVRREMYHESCFARMVDRVNYYADARPLPEGTPNYFGVVTVLLQSMCMDVHDELRCAWSVINDPANADRRTEMIAEFDALPFTDTADMKRQIDELGEDGARLRWTKFFRAQYRNVIASPN